MAGKRGRPPKHKPLNTGDRQPQAQQPQSPPLSPSHSSSSSTTKNDSSLPKLLIPSTDILKKIVSSKHIESLVTKYEQTTDTNTIDTTSSNNNNQSVDESDLIPAIKDVNTFKQYLSNTKQLLNDQIDKLNQFKDQRQEFIVQRLKYNTLKKQLKSSESNTTQISEQHHDHQNIVVDHDDHDDEEGDEDNKHEHTQKMAIDDDDDDNNFTSKPTTSTTNTSTNITITEDTKSNNNNSSSTTTVTTPTNSTTPNLSGRLRKKPKHHDEIDDIDIGTSHDIFIPSATTTVEKPKVMKLTELDNSDLLVDDQAVTSESDSSFPSTTTMSSTSTAASSKKSSSASSAGKKKGNAKRKGPKEGDHKKKSSSHHHDNEQQPKVHYVGPNVFWAAMDSYFRNITDADLELITPKGEDFYSNFLYIPPLGPHYTEVWTNEDQERIRHSTSGGGSIISRQQHRSSTSNLNETDQPDHLGDVTGTSNELNLGDLSIRLLSCFIDENILSATGNSGGNTTTTGSLSSSGAGGLANSSTKILPNDSIVIDYNASGKQLSIEERIQRELLSLGFYDDYHTIHSNSSSSSSSKNKQSQSSNSISNNNNNNGAGNSYEDDEICAELRYIQNQLRDQVNINNQLKSQALQTSTSKILSKQKEKEKKLVFISNAEKNYQKYMKRDRKKKKLVKSNQHHS